MTSFDVLIVGAGHGGAQAAIALRQKGFVGSIALVGAEADPPYDRPALSKDYLAGAKSFDRILLRPEKMWAERKVELLLGQSVTLVDAAAHLVTTESGRILEYHKLIWAAGGQPRLLFCPGSELAGIHSVRSRDDVDRLQSELPTVERIVVVGGGYIGLEAAAVLRQLGKHVTIVEALDRVLARVAGEKLSRFYEEVHRSHGVELRLGAAVSKFVGEEGRVTGVTLVDGEDLAADLVIVGIGIVPSVAPLLTAGAQGENGVDVDAYCRTSLPDVFAIGDCAAHSNIHVGGARIRLESVQNATDQAATVAAAIVGENEPYRSLPWFWSHQYDLRLQTIGLSMGYTDSLVRGDPATRSFSILYLRGSRLAALDCVNAPKDFAQGRSLIGAEIAAFGDALADTALPLKSFMPA